MEFTKQFLFLWICILSNYQLLAFEVFRQTEEVNSSELCIITISPKSFGWNLGPDAGNQIEYNARISQAPDLPQWMHYSYDSSTSTGLLYGVPPARLASIDFDVIGWNRHQSYEVRQLIITMEITKKPRYEYILELKIDNMDVKDLSSPRRMARLLNMFSNFLDWTKEDGSQVKPVYMASADQLGEVLIPSPSDPEGVILHLGSNKNFSTELYRLQAEVGKLWKLRPCPRDLKRTSLEKYFRGQGFLSDWCSFRLTFTSDDQSLNSEENLGLNPDGIESEDVDEPEYSQKGKDSDIFQFKTSIPERGYGVGILLATIVPGTIGGLVGFLLMALLWSDRDETAPADGDALFFEAAFRMLKLLCSCRKQTGNGNSGLEYTPSQKRGDYHHYRPPSEDEDFVMMTADDERFVPSSEDREISTTPLPPQYGATHPNGSPALTYAV